MLYCRRDLDRDRTCDPALRVCHRNDSAILVGAHRWWVLLITGSLKATIMTLLAWATAGTLVHGIGEIALAFLVRGVGRNVASRR